jgi:hypothetical protein
LDETEQYKKFDWLECDLTRNTNDPRPESFRPKDVTQLNPVGHVDTSANWRERRRLVLQTAKVYTKLQTLLDAAKANTNSLAVFRPAEVLNFIWEADDRDWDQSKVEEMRRQSKQGVLFEEESWRQTFKLIKKLPYNFSYVFRDEDGKKSTLQVLDWEVGQLYWNCRKQGGDEEDALKKVRLKYYDEFLKRDLHFFLGTTQQFHGWALNPWVIIGVFPIPHEQQAGLF